MTDLTVIILTYNEELHIRRAIESLRGVATTVVIIDSFSTDNTVTIAETLGAKVYQHQFVNYAKQFEWALSSCEIDTKWVMRMDADEYLTKALNAEVIERLPNLPEDIYGVIFKRQVHFMGRWIKHGGYYPVKLLRIWKNGFAHIEQRWMDEHMVLDEGKAIEFGADIVDDNLNSLTWWTDKHNSYATREAIDLLIRRHNITVDEETEPHLNSTRQAKAKRWYKNNLYLKLPLFLRAFLYFQFRFWIKFGFLDGKKGLIWHFLQGFWYRFLVDAKIVQIEWWAKTENKTIQQVVEERFGVKI